MMPASSTAPSRSGRWAGRARSRSRRTARGARRCDRARRRDRRAARAAASSAPSPAPTSTARARPGSSGAIMGSSGRRRGAVDDDRAGRRLGVREQAARRFPRAARRARHLGEAAVGLTQRTPDSSPACTTASRRGLGAQQRARAVLARRQQARLAQRLALARHLGLTLAQQRRELSDGQLLDGAQREQPQPVSSPRSERDRRARRARGLARPQYMRPMRMKRNMDDNY